jgi:hypothetical protein
LILTNQIHFLSSVSANEFFQILVDDWSKSLIRSITFHVFEANNRNAIFVFFSNIRMFKSKAHKRSLIYFVIILSILYNIFILKQNIGREEEKNPILEAQADYNKHKTSPYDKEYPTTEMRKKIEESDKFFGKNQDEKLMKVFETNSGIEKSLTKAQNKEAGVDKKEELDKTKQLDKNKEEKSGNIIHHESSNIVPPAAEFKVPETSLNNSVTTIPHKETIEINPLGGPKVIEECFALYNSERSYKKLKECIIVVNKNSPVYNSNILKTFDPDLILTLMVHKRTLYINIILDYLSRVHGIENITLVVSHDGYSPDMVEMIRNIKFCRVKQYKLI